MHECQEQVQAFRAENWWDDSSSNRVYILSSFFCLIFSIHSGNGSSNSHKAGCHGGRGEFSESVSDDNWTFFHVFFFRDKKIFLSLPISDGLLKPSQIQRSSHRKELQGISPPWTFGMKQRDQSHLHRASLNLHRDTTSNSWHKTCASSTLIPLELVRGRWPWMKHGATWTASYMVVPTVSFSVCISLLYVQLRLQLRRWPLGTMTRWFLARYVYCNYYANHLSSRILGVCSSSACFYTSFSNFSPQCRSDVPRFLAGVTRSLNISYLKAVPQGLFNRTYSSKLPSLETWLGKKNEQILRFVSIAASSNTARQWRLSVRVLSPLMGKSNMQQLSITRYMSLRVRNWPRDWRLRSLLDGGSGWSFDFVRCGQICVFMIGLSGLRGSDCM